MRQNLNLDTFLPSRYYHIFNRTNNKELLFTQQKNYLYFLEKYAAYLNPVLTTYAYCLLGNHFHFLVRINTEEDLISFQKEGETFNCHQIISHQFNIFFSTYSKAFNKQEGRQGSLFQRPFKRVEIASEVKFGNIIYYIHANPALHRISADFTTYKWSSYQTFLSDRLTSIPRKEILEWFGGLDLFLKYHRENHEFRTQSWILE